jgi:CHAT domain-containing protein
MNKKKTVTGQNGNKLDSWETEMISVKHLPINCNHLLLGILFGVFVFAPPTLASVDEAQALQQQAIQRIERYIDHFRRTFDRNSLRQELIQAQRELEESAALFWRAGLLEGAGHSLVKLGDSHRYLDNWDAAMTAYEDALRAAREAHAPAVECKALLGHARAHLYGKNATGAALELVNQALPLAEKVDDRSYSFDAWDLLAQVQLSQGDLVGAADSMNRAFSFEKAMQDDKLLYYGYLDRADVYQKFAEKCDYQRDFKPCLDAADRARRDYEAALAIARKFNWDGLADQTRGFIKRLDIRKELIEGQQRMHELAAESDIFSPRNADDVVVSKQFTTGANPQLAGLFALLENQGGMPPLTDARGAYIKGLLSEAAGNGDEALESYLRAADMLEDDLRSLYDERTRGSIIEDKVEFYYTAILHLIDRQRYEQAFELMERSQSRVMSDLIATRDIALSSPRERGLYASMLELRGQIAQYQACLFALRSGIKADADCKTMAAQKPAEEKDDRGVIPAGESEMQAALNVSDLQRALEKLQEKYAAIRDRMTAETPRLARLVSSAPVHLGTLQKMLAADGSELIAYLTLESQLLIWHIGPDSLNVRSIFLPRSALKQKIEQLRKSLVHPALPYDRKVAYELYLYLITPVLKWIKSGHLVIVPHEDLHYIPFQALQTDLEDGFLGDDYHITYAPSATVLVSLGTPVPLVKPKLLAVADPSLQHAPGEVRAIGLRFSGRVVSDVLPAEDEVKALVPGTGLVHLAVHGRFAADEPLLSHLQFKSGGGDDGRLTAAEMYGLPLDSARLVVLSACETGSVRATHANEVIGMMRGLIFAGADALLLSAWKIDDKATAEWMQTFYAGARTYSLSRAAQIASKALRENPRYRHPWYWSPFLPISR